MIHKNLNKKYILCVRFRNELPYYNFWFKRSNVFDRHGNSLGFDIGLHLYFFHLSIYVNPF